MNGSNSSAILLVGHGSPRSAANEGFIGLAARLSSRLGVEVLPTFFSIARPNIEDQVVLLAGRGVKRIVLMPYFLYSGQHVTKDIPALLDECRAKFPQVTLEVLGTLENDLTVEDVVLERLLPYCGGASRENTASALPSDGPGIERRSFEIIGRRLGASNEPSQAVIRRVVHATADFSFAQSMRLSPQAVEQGIAAIRAGKPIICDVRMLQSGLTRCADEVICAIGDADVIQAAKSRGCTQAVAAMEKLASKMDGGIVAIGNAPTALFKVIEMATAAAAKPALIVGLPVGFVGAAESKQALIDSGLCHVSNIGPRGGSPAAAAAVNALADLAGKRKRSDA